MIFRGIVLASLLAAQAAAQCSVCGEGMAISAADAIFEFPGQPSVECAILQEAGCQGLVPIDQCAFLPALIGSCVCVDG